MLSDRPTINILFVEARYFGSRALPVNENLSLYILATFLKDNLPEVDFNFSFAHSGNYMKYTKNHDFDLCGIYAATQAWNQANKVASHMKAKGVLGIVGGPHISSAPYSLSHNFVAGCLGPGEVTLQRLVETYLKFKGLPISELSKIAGIVFHENGQLKINPRSSSRGTLDYLPSPYKYYLKPDKIRTNIISSMGCPHHCFFCSAKVINPTLQMYSAESICSEIEFLYKTHKITSFKFIDDNFLASKRRVEDIVTLLDKNNILGKIKVACTSSSKFIDRDTVAMLKVLGGQFVAIGFESGSESVLEKLKCGKISLEEHKRAIHLLNESNIKISGTFILGTPGETISDLDKTVRFIKDHKIHNVQAYFIKPLPGTLFWDELISLGKITKEAVNFEELDLTNINPKWYFNDRVPLEVTVRYLKKIKWLGYYRTIRYNFTDKLLYQAIYRELKLLLANG